MELSWNAEADIESGIRYFNIYKNGQLIARYPKEADFQIFDTNGDDAVPVDPPAMVYRISGLAENRIDTIAITTVNRFNLESAKEQLLISDTLK